MASESVVDQIVKSLSFEVEAVPQEDVTKLGSTSNSTPLNVRIRVRKKEESGMQQGFLSVPKFGRPDAISERIRLISSDQTIMSFDVSMEADFAKKPKRKSRKLFFGGCLGTQYDDDEVPYLPSSAYNAKITDTSISSKSDGVIRQKFTLSKTNYNNSDTLQQNTKKESILGKCKPGGCLDPPYGEEKYSYEPIKILKDKKPSITDDTVKKNAGIKITNVYDGHKTRESKQLSRDSLVKKAKTKADDNAISILSLYDNSLKGSIDSKYSESVITYPPLTSPTASSEKISRNKMNSEEKPRKSYDASIEAFYSSPNKNKRFNEKTGNGTDDNKRENFKTIVPLANNTTFLKTDESHIIAPHVQNSLSPKETKMESDASVITSMREADLSTNVSKLNNLHKHPSNTNNLVMRPQGLTKYIEDMPNGLNTEAKTTISSTNLSKKAVPMFQPSPVDYVNSDSEIEPTNDKSGIPSYLEPYGKTNKLLKKSFQSNLHDKAAAVEDQYKNATRHIIKEDEKRSQNELNGQEVAMQDQHKNVRRRLINEDGEELQNKLNDKSVITQDQHKNAGRHITKEDEEELQKKIDDEAVSVQVQHKNASKNIIEDDEEESQNKLDDKVVAMQDHKNAHILNENEEGSLDSIPDLKIQINNYHPEEVTYNQNQVISNQNGLQSNKPGSEDSKQKTIPKESLNLLKYPNVVTSPIVNLNDHADNISKQPYTDHISAEYNHTKKLKNKEILAEDSLNLLNDLTIPKETTLSKDDNILKSKIITKMHTSDEDLNIVPDYSIEPNQKFTQNSDKEGNKRQPGINEDYKETEFMLQEKKLSTNTILQQNKIEDTYFNNEVNVTYGNSNDELNQIAEPINYNTFSEPVNEENSDRNIDKENNNLTHILTQSVLTLNQQNLPKTESSQIAKLKSLTDSKSNLSSFVKEPSYDEDNIKSFTEIDNTNEVKPPHQPVDNSEFIYPLTSEFVRNKTHDLMDKPTMKRITTQSELRGKDPIKSSKLKLTPVLERSDETHYPKDKPTIERISSQLELPGKYFISASNLKLKPISDESDGKSSAEEEYQASEKSSKISFKKDSISLDLAFQSYVNDGKERKLKTIDTSVDHVRYPDDSLTVIQSHLRPNVNEIRIPIDIYNDMIIQVHRTKSPTQHEQEPYGYNKPVPTLSKHYGVPDFPNENNCDNFSHEYREKTIGNEIPTILNFVYEQELIPLQKTINYLKKEIESLASQQSILIDQLASARRTKPIRLLRVNSRCACYKK